MYMMICHIMLPGPCLIQLPSLRKKNESLPNLLAPQQQGEDFLPFFVFFFLPVVVVATAPVAAVVAIAPVVAIVGIAPVVTPAGGAVTYCGGATTVSVMTGKGAAGAIDANMPLGAGAGAVPAAGTVYAVVAGVMYVAGLAGAREPNMPLVVAGAVMVVVAGAAAAGTG
mmetsp:Transcript_120556/g.196067  ORF Transcript_120556/g.196067 Transcript_120556/m.196067 type:complete len:169 (-) Transcript_120556:265-771(-)